MVCTIKTNAEFDKQLEKAGSKLVVLDFYTTWCGACKEMNPTVRSLEKKYDGKIVVLKINADKFEDLSSKYKVSSLPTFVFIKNKKKVSSFSGADEDKLTKRIEKLAKK